MLNILVFSGNGRIPVQVPKLSFLASILNNWGMEKKMYLLAKILGVTELEGLPPAGLASSL